MTVKGASQKTRAPAPLSRLPQPSAAIVVRKTATGPAPPPVDDDPTDQAELQDVAPRK